MNWPTVEIRDIAEVVSGYGFPHKHQGQLDEDFPFYKVGDMNTEGNEVCMTVAANTISGETLQKLKARAFPAGTVIFPKIGAAIATNKKRVLTQPSVFDNNVMGFIPSELIDNWYLFYWMQQFDLRTVSNAGPVPSMRKSEVERVRIPFPPRSEQQRIVKILEQADALRQKRRSADDLARLILPALFNKMFGDPAKNPHDWETVSFDDAMTDRTSKSGKLQRKMYKASGSIPVIDQGQKFIAGYSDDESLTTYVDDPIIVFGDHTRIVKLVEFPFIVGADGVKVLVAKEGFTPGFLAAHLRASNIRNLGYSRHMRVVKKLAFMKPPYEFQKEFDGYARATFSILSGIDTSQEQLNQLVRVLLHRAFTGVLTAKWREAHKVELKAEMQEQMAALKQARTNKPKRGHRRKASK